MRWIKEHLDYIIIFTLLAFLFQPKYFTYINSVNWVYGILSLITFLICLIVYIVKRKMFSVPIFFIGIFLTLSLIVTTINDGEILKMGYMCTSIGSFLMLCDLCYKDNKLNKFMESLFVLLTLLLFVNLIFIPRQSDIYFLGIRTRVVDYALPLIFLASLLANKSNKYLNFLVVFGTIVSFLNLVVFNVTTCWIGLAIIVLMYFILKIKISDKFLNNYTLLGLCFLGFIGITFFNIQDIFSGVLEAITGKGADFTGRTDLWLTSYPLIKEKIIFGHGLINDGNFIPRNGELWQAHNAYLQILYDNGIIGLLVMIVYIVMSFGGGTKQRNKKQIVCSAFMVGILIMMITEVYTYYLIFYTFAAITYYINNDKEVKISEK